MKGFTPALAALVVCGLYEIASAAPRPTPSPAASNAYAQLAPGYAPLAFAGLTLQQAQDDAVTQSPDVEIARAKVDAASASLSAARTGIGPSIFAGYVRNPQSAAVPPAIVTQHSFNVGLSTTLLSITQFLPLLYQAEATYRLARADAAAAERNERIRAANLYFTALRTRAIVSARREALSLATAQQQAAQKRFKAGDAPHIDVVRAEVVAAQALAALENAQAADANAAQALTLETGVAAAAIADTAPGSLPEVTAATSEPDSAVQRAMVRRSEIISARENVSAASAGVSAARVGILPTVTFSAGYEHAVDVGNPIQGPTVNALVELPLTSASGSRINAATAALTQARAQERAEQRLVTIEVSSAVRNLNAAIQATAASTRARQAAQEELNATVIGYRSGASSSLERTAASATYAEARLAELGAIYDEALARAVVNLELGP
ncbi:MAG TPA: TolC family protein [Candidatus Eremiobacteraceae bacterium]|nr:TolC family protein [Candidatus Eremiobacteraceae bacterium]